MLNTKILENLSHPLNYQLRKMITKEYIERYLFDPSRLETLKIKILIVETSNSSLQVKITMVPQTEANFGVYSLFLSNFEKEKLKLRSTTRKEHSLNDFINKVLLPKIVVKSFPNTLEFTIEYTVKLPTIPILDLV